MTTRQILCAALLVPFLALTSYVLTTDGLLGFYQAAFANRSTLLMSADLLLALGLVLLWMHADARANGTPFLPYLLITLAIGVAGPLGYLIHREAHLRRARARERAAIARPTSGTKLQIPAATRPAYENANGEGAQRGQRPADAIECRRTSGTGR